MIKTHRPKGHGTRRANITCSRPLYSEAIQIVDNMGFRTFSGYVEFLMRIDIERRKKQQRA